MEKKPKPRPGAQHPGLWLLTRVGDDTERYIDIVLLIEKIPGQDAPEVTHRIRAPPEPRRSTPDSEVQHQ